MADEKRRGLDVPKDYRAVAGSERRPGKSARRLGAADADEVFSVTIVLRRSPDGPRMPGHDDFQPTTSAGRKRLAPDDFAAKYGASPADIEAVTKFTQQHNLNVVSTHAARRTLVVSGNAPSMSNAFAVDLGRYEHEVLPSRRRGAPQNETYRGRDGLVHVPKALADVVVGVFGLDNRRITMRNVPEDPPNTTPLSTAEITALYNFPPNSAAGQTIAIMAFEGYLTSDIKLAFVHPPTITNVHVGVRNGIPSTETTQDIVIAGQAAPGAALAVYFATDSQQGWVDLVSRVVHPDPHDPVCSVISSSYYISDGDDPLAFLSEGVTVAWLNAVTMAFQDAAVQGVTICVASGDAGSSSLITDLHQHVQYPASDPWVLSCGGTTIGNVVGSSFDEYVWNDDFGATGGGVSERSPRPTYQSDAGVPPSLHTGFAGRGVPDVAANASPFAGYSGIAFKGHKTTGSGTSASAPLWAGLVARLNAALGYDLGFFNPTIYALRSAGFRDISGAAGPTDNSTFGVPGYPAGVGWDACTGWGSPNGVALLQAIRNHRLRHYNWELNINPLELLLQPDVHVPLHIPGPPPIEVIEAQAERLARTLTEPERREALARVQGFAQYARVLARALESASPPADQSLPAKPSS